MTRSPSFQFYPDKAIAGTDHLSPESFKAFWKVVWWMWLHSPDYCSIPDNEPAWITATGIHDKTKLSEVRNEIMQPHMPLLKKCGEMLVCNGVKKEAEKQSKRSASAKKSLKYRWPNKKQILRTNSERKETVCSESSFPTPTPFPIPTTYKELSASEDFRKAWEAFIAHRIEIKKAMTIRAAELILMDCHRWGPVVSVEAIYQSIRCRYTGVFRPKRFERNAKVEKDTFI